MVERQILPILAVAGLVACDPTVSPQAATESSTSGSGETTHTMGSTEDTTSVGTTGDTTSVGTTGDVFTSSSGQTGPTSGMAESGAGSESTSSGSGAEDEGSSSGSTGGEEPVIPSPFPELTVVWSTELAEEPRAISGGPDGRTAVGHASGYDVFDGVGEVTSVNNGHAGYDLARIGDDQVAVLSNLTVRSFDIETGDPVWCSWIGVVDFLGCDDYLQAPDFLDSPARIETFGNDGFVIQTYSFTYLYNALRYTGQGVFVDMVELSAPSDPGTTTTHFSFASGVGWANAGTSGPDIGKDNVAYFHWRDLEGESLASASYGEGYDSQGIMGGLGMRSDGTVVSLIGTPDAEDKLRLVTWGTDGTIIDDSVLLEDGSLRSSPSTMHAVSGDLVFRARYTSRATYDEFGVLHWPVVVHVSAGGDVQVHSLAQGGTYLDHTLGADDALVVSRELDGAWFLEQHVLPE